MMLDRLIARGQGTMHVSSVEIAAGSAPSRWGNADMTLEDALKRGVRLIAHVLAYVGDWSRGAQQHAAGDRHSNLGQDVDGGAADGVVKLAYECRSGHIAERRKLIKGPGFTRALEHRGYRRLQTRSSRKR